jgi:5,10-methylene-tetrahydrofolate dehydrogenase/methenyl tetrahydrofolate cyclohydrolase
MLLLKWKEKSEWLKNKYRELRAQYFWNERKFVAVLFFGESNPSQVYVNLKKKYSHEIWFDFLVFGQWDVLFEEEYPDLIECQKKDCW